MKRVESMQKLIEEIISSFDARIADVAGIVSSTYEMLEGFRENRMEMKGQLSKALAIDTSLRKKDFEAMLKNVQMAQEKREQNIRNTLKTFISENKKLAAQLKESLGNGDLVSTRDTAIYICQKAQEVKYLLSNFYDEQAEFVRDLQRLLEKNGSLRIKDFKTVIRGISTREKKRKKEVENMLAGFSKEQQRVTVVCDETPDATTKEMELQSATEVTCL